MSWEELIVLSPCLKFSKVGNQEVRHYLKLQTVKTHTKQTKSNIIQRSNIKRNCSACKGVYPVGASIVRAKGVGEGGRILTLLSLCLSHAHKHESTQLANKHLNVHWQNN